MAETINVTQISTDLRRVWRAARLLSFLSGVFAFTFLFVAIVIILSGKQISLLEYGVVALPTAIFAYFYAVSGNHGLNLWVFAIVVFLLSLIDLIVTTDVTLRIKENSALSDYLRMGGSWLFFFLVAMPTAVAAFRLKRPRSIFGNISYRNVTHQVSETKRKNASGILFRPGRRPVAGLFLGAAAGVALLLIPLSMWELSK